MLKAGTIIVERYEIIGRIGSGGMADVYKAKDHKLNRYVAVKVLKQEFREDTTFIKKFTTEAQSAAGLAHPNIVNVFDVGEDDGIHFIVMELVEGITLKEYITKKGKLTIREATSIAIQVSMGLEAAHAHNIVHRDVKPQNIIISTDGKVKVTDFGIARAASSNTISSNVMGSVHYSSPEQVRGGYSDAKSDIYSLGITIYEMVTGRIPFDGDTTVAIAIKHLQDEMEPPSTYVPDIPHSLEQIIFKCTQKSVDRRYNNMTEVIADLKHSLIDPNGDFVTLVPLSNHAKTVMLSKEDLEAIQQQNEQGRSQKTYPTIDEDAYIRNQQMEDDEEEEDEEDEDDEEQGEVNSKLEKALTIGGFIVGGIVILLLILLIAQSTGIIKGFNLDFLSSKSNNEQEATPTAEPTTETEPTATAEPTATPTAEASDTQVTVPNLLGKTQSEATQIANGLSLGITYAGEEASNDYPKGQVIRQSIAADTKVDAHTTIEITLSSGPADENVTIPDVVGKTQAEAEAMLQDLGLVVESDKTNSNTVAVGNVITVSPGVGESVKKGSTVTLSISTGSSDVKVQVLEVRGLDEATAKEVLTNLGLVVTIKSGTSDRVGEGDVISQSLSAGEEVAVGTEIVLTVNGAVAGETSATGNWQCTARLEAPNNYQNGVVKLELTQNVDGEAVTTTILENQNITFPYVLNISGADGVESGTVTMYEQVNGNYVSIAEYGPVKFKQVS